MEAGKHWGSQQRTRVGISPQADLVQEMGWELIQVSELLSLPLVLLPHVPEQILRDSERNTIFRIKFKMSQHLPQEAPKPRAFDTLSLPAVTNQEGEGGETNSS